MLNLNLDRVDTSPQFRHDPVHFAIHYSLSILCMAQADDPTMLVATRIIQLSTG